MPHRAAVAARASAAAALALALAGCETVSDNAPEFRFEALQPSQPPEEAPAARLPEACENVFAHHIAEGGGHGAPQLEAVDCGHPDRCAVFRPEEVGGLSLGKNPVLRIDEEAVAGHAILPIHDHDHGHGDRCFWPGR